VKPSDLNVVAADILTNTDPSIALIKERILAYSENSGSASSLRQSVEATDKLKIKQSGKWLNSFYDESHKNNFRDDQFSKLIAGISTYKGTKTEKFASDLAKNSEEPLRTWINSINLKKEKITSPEELILYVLRNKEKNNITDGAFFSSLANLSSSANIPADTIKSQMIASQHHKLWYLWVIGAAGVLFLFFFFRRKRNKDKEKKD
jgi:hypothetical protein